MLSSAPDELREQLRNMTAHAAHQDPGSGDDASEYRNVTNVYRISFKVPCPTLSRVT